MSVAGDVRTANDRTSALRDFGDVFGALDRLPVPIFAIGRDGVIRWLNMSAEEIVGDKRGAHFAQLVSPESKAVVNDAFASKIVASRSATDYEAVLIKDDSTRVNVEICSVPVSDGEGGIAGVFGAVAVRDDQHARRRAPTKELTPRQAEVLAYLARGYATDQMATMMGVSKETVRNHVRGLLRTLGVHSRLEAVTTAHMRGLV